MRPARRTSLRLAAILAALSLQGACSDATAPVEPAIDVRGQYVATTYLIGEAGAAPGDVLAEGGSYSLELASGNAMQQELWVPESLAGPGGMGMTVNAIWTLDGQTVNLTDPFVDQRFQAVHLIVRGDSLTDEHTVDGHYVKVVFHRR